MTSSNSRRKSESTESDANTDSMALQGRLLAKSVREFLRFVQRVLKNFEIPSLVIFAALPAEAFASDGAAKEIFSFIGFFFFALGAGLRFWSRGYEKRGRFVLDGPYRYVQNPDELGSLLLLVGSFLAAGVLWSWAFAFGLLVWAYFYCLSNAYLANLRLRVGASFSKFIVRVPKWFPSTYPCVNRSGAVFSWKRALREEKIFYVWMLGMLLIFAVRRWWIPR